MVAPVAHRHVHAQYRRRRPRKGGGEIHHRAIEKIPLPVIAFAVRRGAARPQSRRQPAVEFQAHAGLVHVRYAAQPLPLSGSQQAELGNRARQPARPGVGGQKGLIEVARRILPHRQVGPHPQAQPFAQRLLVLAAAPHRDTEARLGAEIPFALEGQPTEYRVDVDDLALRSSVEVTVRGDGGAEIAGPALAGAA